MTIARRPKMNVKCPKCDKVGRPYTFNSGPWYWCQKHGAYRYAYQPNQRMAMFCDFKLIGSRAVKI